jgi:hypothetical protein
LGESRERERERDEKKKKFQKLRKFKEYFEEKF